MIRACERQVRVGIGGVYALDFGAILAFAAARGGTSRLLASVLPDIEPLVLNHPKPKNIPSILDHFNQKT